MTSGRISDLALLEPEFRLRLRSVLDQTEEKALPFRVYETIRSPGRQTALYARGRDRNRPDFGRTVTKARAWQSAHQYGQAADIVGWENGEWSWEDHLPWAKLHEVAIGAGLVTLSFEKPHVQLAGFDFNALEHGPDTEAGWLQWLRVVNG